MGLLSKEDSDDGLSPLEILAEAVCSIAREKFNLQLEKQENSSVPPKNRSSVYFNFLNDMSSPSNPNIMPCSTSKEGHEERSESSSSSHIRDGSQDHDKVVLVVDEDEKSGSQERQQPLFLKIKKRSHCHIQQIPNLLEECCPHPKKRRSSSPKCITLFGQKITVSTPKLASTSASSTESDHIQKAQPTIINNADLKRKYINDDDGKDWAVATHKRKKKNENSNMNLKMKKVMNRKGKGVTLPPQELPEEFKQVIVGQMNGTRLELLAEKRLFCADIKKDQGRFSLPREQVSSKKFLRRNEMKWLKKYRLLPVPLLDPVLAHRHITLGWWKMSTKNSLVLKSEWNDIVDEHLLGIGDVVQVWSFRVINPEVNNNDLDKDLGNDIPIGDDDPVGNDEDNEGQLHLALVLVKRGDPISREEEGSKGSSTTTPTDGASSSNVSNNGSDEDHTSSSLSHKEQEVIGGSRSGSCSPPENEGSTSPKIPDQAVNRD